MAILKAFACIGFIFIIGLVFNFIENVMSTQTYIKNEKENTPSVIRVLTIIIGMVSHFLMYMYFIILFISFIKDAK